MDYTKFFVSNKKEESISIQKVKAFSVKLKSKLTLISFLFKKNLRLKFRISQVFLIFGYDAVLN